MDKNCYTSNNNAQYVVFFLIWRVLKKKKSISSTETAVTKPYMMAFFVLMSLVKRDLWRFALG